MDSYQQSAIDFLKKTSTEMTVKFIKHAKHFEDDKEERDIYEIELKRKNRSMKIMFGQSINNSGFYYTKGKQKIAIERKHLENKNLFTLIRSRDRDFLNNGKSDIIHKPVQPTAYNVLVCIQKYDVGTLKDFCSEFGYDEDSKKVEKTYNAVKEEYLKVCAMFSDEEMEQLMEIQ